MLGFGDYNTDSVYIEWSLFFFFFQPWGLYIEGKKKSLFIKSGPVCRDPCSELDYCWWSHWLSPAIWLRLCLVEMRCDLSCFGLMSGLKHGCQTTSIQQTLSVCHRLLLDASFFLGPGAVGWSVIFYILAMYIKQKSYECKLPSIRKMAMGFKPAIQNCDRAENKAVRLLYLLNFLDSLER